MLKLECEALAEEGCDHWAFMEACSTVLQAWPIKAHGVLMYPLQLLTGNVPLAAMLATVGWEPPSTTTPLTVSRMPTPQTRTKWQHCSSNQEAMMPRPEEEKVAMLDVTPKEHPHQRQKKGRPLVRLLKESHQEASRKDSDLIDTTRWVYFKMCCPNIDHEGSHDLSHTFQEMATSTGLMSSEVHEVQEVWTGHKDLQATCHMAKGSPKGIQFFWVVSPTKSPKIMGLRESIPPKPFAGKWDCPSVCGVEKRARMR